jgi:hypothetical protein
MVRHDSWSYTPISVGSHRVIDLKRNPIYCIRQTLRAVSAGRAAKRGTCCVRINIHSKKHNLFRYLHGSSYA